MFFKPKSEEYLIKQHQAAEAISGQTFDSEKLSKDYPQEYQSYLKALRQVAAEKHGQELTAPDKYVLMQRNIVKYKNTESYKAFLPHQKEAFEAIEKSFLDGLSSGYVEMPTGTGKTVIFTKLVEAIVGNKENGFRTPKVLILTPGKDLTDQVVGYDYDEMEIEALAKDFSVEDIISGNKNKEIKAAFKTISKKPKGGFAKFAPDLSVLGFHSSVDKSDKEAAREFAEQGGDSPHDVLAMTYQSFMQLKKTGKIAGDFDLVICDEAHRSLGELTSAALKNVSGVKIGFTATSEFSDGRKVADDFAKNEIFSMTINEAIEGDMVATPVIRVVDTGVVMKLDISNGDYSAESLEALNNNEAWFGAAVSETISQIETGRQGLVSCSPSKDLLNPKTMAQILSNSEITDASGIKRKIIAAAIDGSMDYETRKMLYAQYELGKIDCLTFVDVLKEGWDSEAAKFLVNMRPTTSKVIATQRLGRILRLFRRKAGIAPDPIVIELGLKVEEGKLLDDKNYNPVTAMDILAVTEFNADGYKYGTPVDRNRGDLQNWVISGRQVPPMIEIDGEKLFRPGVSGRHGLPPKLLEDLSDKMKKEGLGVNVQGYTYFDENEIFNYFVKDSTKKLDNLKNSDSSYEYCTVERYLKTIGLIEPLPNGHPLSPDSIISLAKGLAPILEKQGVYRATKVDKTGQTIFRPKVLNKALGHQFRLRVNDMLIE